MGLVSGVGCSEASAGFVEVMEPFFRNDFGMILGSILTPKMNRKSTFGMLFCASLFKLVFGAIFEGPKPRKQSFRLDGSTIFTESNARKMDRFWMIFGGKNSDKSDKISV